MLFQTKTQQNNKDEDWGRKTGRHLCPHMCMHEWICTHMCMCHMWTHIHISMLQKNNVFMILILIASLVHKMLLADLAVGESSLMVSVLSQHQQMHHYLWLFMHFPLYSIPTPPAKLYYILLYCSEALWGLILDFQLCPIPNRVSLYSPGWPGTCRVGQADVGLI